MGLVKAAIIGGAGYWAFKTISEHNRHVYGDGQDQSSTRGYGAYGHGRCGKWRRQDTQRSSNQDGYYGGPPPPVGNGEKQSTAPAAYYHDSAPNQVPSQEREGYADYPYEATGQQQQHQPQHQQDEDVRPAMYLEYKDQMDSQQQRPQSQQRTDTRPFAVSNNRYLTHEEILRNRPDLAAQRSSMGDLAAPPGYYRYEPKYESGL